MKNVKIEVPEGYEVDQEKSTFENIIFKKEESINTMEDVYRLNGTTEDEFMKKWFGFEDHEIAMAQEKLIVAAYNKSEKLDWDNSDQEKYYPCFNLDNFLYRDWFYGYSHSAAASRLCFLRKEDLEDATEKFIDIYKRSRLG